MDYRERRSKFEVIAGGKIDENRASGARRHERAPTVGAFLLGKFQEQPNAQILEFEAANHTVDRIFITTIFALLVIAFVSLVG